MGTLLASQPGIKAWTNGHQLTLRDAIAAMQGDPPLSIPFLIRLLENPASPVALPGNIDLYGHDCLHILLGRGFSLYDEAFVVGFTMGNDVRTQKLHVDILKFCSARFYPSTYRFNCNHLKAFDLGAAYGQAIKTRNLNQMDFRPYEDQPLDQVRKQFGIDWRTLQILRQTEAILTGEKTAF